MKGCGKCIKIIMDEWEITTPCGAAAYCPDCASSMAEKLRNAEAWPTNEALEIKSLQSQLAAAQARVCELTHELQYAASNCCESHRDMMGSGSGPCPYCENHELRARIAELEERSRWRKWPEEKPVEDYDDTEYLVKTKDLGNYVSHKVTTWRDNGGFHNVSTYDEIIGWLPIPKLGVE